MISDASTKDPSSSDEGEDDDDDDDGNDSNWGGLGRDGERDADVSPARAAWRKLSQTAPWDPVFCTESGAAMMKRATVFDEAENVDLFKTIPEKSKLLWKTEMRCKERAETFTGEVKKSFDGSEIVFFEDSKK